MIHKLSRATTYLQTYYIHPSTGEHTPRSYATGFFLRMSNALLLVTCWHVVSGLDPAEPSKIGLHPPPLIAKITVISRRKFVAELSVPLYSPTMEPLWREHPSGSKVDLVFCPLPLALENHFEFIDIQSAGIDADIAEEVGKDVFILGYPFSREELRESFGEGAPHYLPVWKRGSIATEPAIRLGGRVLLIDSLSRAGMSGAPVVVAQDDKLVLTKNQANREAIQHALAGGSALEAIMKIDAEDLREAHVKHFRFLGVYSGTIGKTRLAEVALGKCWHVETLLELVANPREGSMPFHAPLPNTYYDAFLAQSSKGELVTKDAEGNIVERTSV